MSANSDDDTILILAHVIEAIPTVQGTWHVSSRVQRFIPIIDQDAVRHVEGRAEPTPGDRAAASRHVEKEQDDERDEEGFAVFHP